MAKRIVTRIGNVFCVEIRNEYKCYFQYIANDWTILNSVVIRVFKRHYPMAYEPNMDEIVHDSVTFYAHTILRAGLNFGAWYKVGTSKELGDTENIMFRAFDDVNYGLRGQTKSTKWRIWKINESIQFVGEMTDAYRKYDIGFIFSYIDIVAKIETGKFFSKMLD